MSDAHKLSQTLAGYVDLLGGPNSSDGAHIKALSYSSDLKYSLIEQKYQTVDFFYTRKEKYLMSSVYSTLKNRRMTMGQIIRDPPNNFVVPTFQTLSRRKSLPDPSQGPKVQKKWWDFMSRKPPVVTALANQTVVNHTPAPVPAPVPITVAPVVTTETNSSAVPDADRSPGTLDFSKFAGLDLEFQDPWYNEPINISLFGHTKNVVKRSVPNDPHNLNPHPVPYPVVRNKRQLIVGAIIGSLLTSIGVGSIFGTIGNSQINTIKEAQKDDHTKQTLIIHQLEKDSDFILTNRNKISGLEALTIKIAKFSKIEHFKQNSLLLFVMMDTEYSRVLAALDEYVGIVEAAQLHKFYPGVLSREGAISSFDEIKALAEVRGLTPVIQNAQQFSQLETSFYFTTTGITLIVNIPLTSEQMTFSLFKFNALPIKLGNNVVLELVPQNSIIAIGEPESNGHPRYVELSLYDLSMCQKLGSVHICKDQRIVHKPNPHSCLYALFEGLHEDARHACQISLKGRKHDQVVSIGADRFRYYSVTPSSYFLHCQNNSIIRGKQLEQITDIVIPKNCRAETAHFILYRRSDLYDNIQPRHYKWTLPVLSFLSNTSIDSIDEAIKTIESTPGSPPITKETYETFERLNRPFYHNKYVSATLLIALLGLALGLIIVSVVVYTTCKGKHMAKKHANTNYRMKQLLGKDENLEELEMILNERSETRRASSE